MHENKDDEESNYKCNNKRKSSSDVVNNDIWRMPFMMSNYNISLIIHDNIHKVALFLIMNTIVFTEPIGLWLNLFVLLHFICNLIADLTTSPTFIFIRSTDRL